MTAKSNRPDIHRAANHILRICLDGKITLTLAPPGYEESIDRYREHPDLVKIAELLGHSSAGQEESRTIQEEDLLTDSDEENNTDETDEDDETVTRNKFSALALSPENY